MIATLIAFGLLSAINFHNYNPLSEDSNGNTIPDIVEVQKGTFYPSQVPCVVTLQLATVVIVAVFLPIIVYRLAMEHRNLIDVTVKIFKSKYRVVGMKISALVVCLVMFGFLAGFVSAAPFDEDSDGDGVPDVIENSIYMNSTVNPEAIESGDTTNVELSVDYRLNTKAPLDVVLVLDKSSSMALPVGAEKDAETGYVKKGLFVDKSLWEYTFDVNDLAYMKIYINNILDPDLRDSIIVKLIAPNGTVVETLAIDDDEFGIEGSFEIQNPDNGAWKIQVQRNWNGFGYQSFEITIHKVPKVLPRFEGTISEGNEIEYTFNVLTSMDELHVIACKNVGGKLQVEVISPSGKSKTEILHWFEIVDVIEFHDPEQGTWKVRIKCLSGSNVEYKAYVPISKIDMAKMAMKSFINNLDDDDRVAVVTFGDSASLEIGFTNDFENAKSIIDNIAIRDVSTTNLYDGLSLSNNLFNNSGRIYAEWAIIVLSDGWDIALNPDPRGQAEVSKNYGIKIYTIGYGLIVPYEDLLKDIATETGGQYYYAPSDETLEEICQCLKKDIMINATVVFKLSDSVEFVDATGGYQRENKTITWYVEELPWQASITVKPIKAGRVKINADNGSYLAYTVKIGHMTAEGIKYFNDTYVFVDVSPVVNLTAPSSVAVGNIEFNVVAYDLDGGNVYWTLNFGDGESMSDINNKTVIHIYNQTGNYTVTLIAYDDEQNHKSLVTEIKIYNNPPQINVGDSYEVNEDETLTLTVTASDPDGHNVEITVENLPENASFNGHTFTWKPSYDFVKHPNESRSVTVTFKATDEYGATSTKSVIITVKDVNRAPVITGVGWSAYTTCIEANNATRTYVFMANESDSIEMGTVIKLCIHAYDPDGDEISYSKDKEYGTLETNDFIWVPGYDFVQHPDTSRTVYITFTVSDGELSDNVTVKIIVNDVNRAPIIDGIEGETTVNENETLNLTILAHDPDGDNLTYTKNVTFGTLNGNIFTWKTDYDDAGTYVIEFTVSDGFDSDKETVTVTVNNVNRPPELTVLPESPIINEDEIATLTVTAYDPDGDEVTVTWSSPELGVTDEPLSGSVWTHYFGYDFVSEGYRHVNVTFNASDGFDVVTKTVTITVWDVPRYELEMNEEQIIKIDAESGEISIVDDASTEMQPINVTNASEVHVTVYSNGTIIVNKVESGNIEFGYVGVIEDKIYWKPGYEFVKHPSEYYTIRLKSVGEGFRETVIIEIFNDEDERIGGLVIEYYTGDITAHRPYNATANVTVHDINRKPEITVPSKVTVNEGEEMKVKINVSDLDGDEINVTVENLPYWANFNDTTWMITGTPDYDFVSSVEGQKDVTVTFIAYDGFEFASEDVTITVINVNRKPSVNITADKTTVSVGESVNFTVNANDEDGDKILITINYDDGYSDKAYVQGSGTVTFTHAFDSSGTYNVTAKAYDGIDTTSDSVQINVTNIPNVNMRVKINGSGPYIGQEIYIYVINKTAYDLGIIDESQFVGGVQIYVNITNVNIDNANNYSVRLYVNGHLFKEHGLKPLTNYPYYLPIEFIPTTVGNYIFKAEITNTSNVNSTNVHVGLRPVS